MNPFFSISVPTLGKLDQWKLALQSVLDQTYKDFEIIAIDSGPEAHSRPLIEKLNDPRIRYIKKSAKDPRINWDTGFRNARGTYMIWFEDDNYMLPWELATLADVIQKTGADLVTGSHVHWRGLTHPIAHARNQLIIPQKGFSGTITKINPMTIIRDIVLTPEHDGAVPTRYGNSMSAAKRTLVLQVLERMHEINFGTTGTHALRLGLLALARNYQFIDTPVAIGANTGVSLSDVWPQQSSSVVTLPPFQYHLSAVTGNTYVNYRHENHLLMYHSFKDIRPDFPRDDEAIFLSIYRKELRYSKLSWTDFVRYWKELFRVLTHSPEVSVRKLSRSTMRYFFMALAIKILRTLHLYEFLKRALENRRKSKKPKTIISLHSYGVTNIRECAQKLPEIIQRELNMSYENFLGITPARKR